MTTYHRYNLSRPWLVARFALALAMIAGALASAKPATATTIQVTTTTDDRLNNGNCTLREAIIAANTDAAVDGCPAGSGADTVLLAAGSYGLSVAGTGEDAAATGDLDVTEDLTIDGASLIGTFISANLLDRAFEVLDNAHLTLSHLTIEDGNGTVGGLGGAIRVEGGGALTLSTARVRDTAGDNNRAIYALTGARLTILSSRIENNPAGGIFLQIGSTGIVRDSSITGNTADGGAGLSVDVGSTLTVVNSTISGNRAGISGGGIRASGVVRLYSVTLADNAYGLASLTGHGGGISVGDTADVFVIDSILADNYEYGSDDPSDCFGTLDSGGLNLIEEVSNCTVVGITLSNLVGVDPLLDVLDNYGGPTLTQRLLDGSPAIDAGPSLGCRDEALAVLLTDQRSFLRNGICDIGAFEYHSPGLATATTVPTATRTGTPTATPTRTATRTPTATATRTPTGTATASATRTPTSTITPTASATPVVCGSGGDRVCATPTITVTPAPCTTNCLYLPAILDDTP
ncbi:MAG: right-handed parallel beta-helix repeat-containing protein [Anaerolineales bacterium]|nr:right-handed parallel beta-helix repeat-containing protein [Anaerolineales bacterium]